MIAISVSKTIQAVLQQRIRNTWFTKICNSNAPATQLSTLSLYQSPQDQEMWSSSSGDEHSSDETVELYDSESKSKPIPFSQEALNDLCKDLYLTEDKSELLESRL